MLISFAKSFIILLKSFKKKVDIVIFIIAFSLLIVDKTNMFVAFNNKINKINLFFGDNEKLIY